MSKNIRSGNIIKINNTVKTIENITCKMYWHLINTLYQQCKNGLIIILSLKLPIEMFGLEFSNCYLKW